MALRKRPISSICLKAIFGAVASLPDGIEPGLTQLASLETNGIETLQILKIGEVSVLKRKKEGRERDSVCACMNTYRGVKKIIHIKRAQVHASKSPPMRCL